MQFSVLLGLSGKATTNVKSSKGNVYKRLSLLIKLHSVISVTFTVRDHVYILLVKKTFTSRTLYSCLVVRILV